MTNAGYAGVSAGAAMMGPDGEVYFVPGQVQAAYRVAGALGSRITPEPGDISANMRIRDRVQAGMADLPQMGLLNC